MFSSVASDVKNTFSYGNMVMKLILINVGIFVITALTEAFFPQYYFSNILPWLALPADLSTFSTRPWTIITYMFVHADIWHIAWNMILLYWFGNITGDLLGDRRVLPIYLYGGIAGGLLFMLSAALLPYVGNQAIGASAAVLAVVFAAVMTAPEYRMHLLLLGEVRIKYIGLVILFLDLIGTSARSGNSGGHIAHLGGTMLGIIFVYLLRNGTDMGSLFYREKKRETHQRKPSLRVAHKAENLPSERMRSLSKQKDLTRQVDEILEKIKKNGYDSLSEEEKEILYKASKS